MRVGGASTAMLLPAAVLLAAGALACDAGEGGKNSSSAGWALPDDGSLPSRLDHVLYGSGRSCDDDGACSGGVCDYGACVGMILVERRWVQAEVADELEELVEGAPDEVRGRAVEHLRGVALRAASNRAHRVRATRALEALEARAALRAALSETSGAVRRAAALALVRLGATSAEAGEGPLAVVERLAASPRASLAMEALRALGASGADEALAPLLARLNPQLDGMRLRAAVDGLVALGDRRVLRPLIAFLGRAPGYLHHRVVRGLRRLTEASSVGQRPEDWRAWASERSLPEPPEVERRRYRPDRELELPTP